MTKIYNFVANVPIYLGMFIRFLGDFLLTIGFRLHITFRTESGKNLLAIEETMRKLSSQIENTSKSTTVKKVSGERNSKLIDIIKGSNDDSNGKG